MQRKFNFIGRVIIFLSVTVLLSSCMFGEPEFTSFDDINVVEIKGKEAELIIKVTLNNPNPRAITIKNAEFDFTVNSVYLGKAVLLSPLVLPKKGEHPVDLHMKLQLDKNLGSLAVSLGFAILTNNLSLNMKGEATASMSWVTKTFQVNLSEKVDWNDLKKIVE